MIEIGMQRQPAGVVFQWKLNYGYTPLLFIGASLTVQNIDFCFRNKSQMRYYRFRHIYHSSKQ